MDYGWTFFRDRIVLNNEFKQRTRLDAAQPGKAVLLAAREISVEGSFDLDGRDLVLLVDSFDGSAGAIRLRAVEGGQPGPRGRGRARRVRWLHRPGGAAWSAQIAGDRRGGAG